MEQKYYSKLICILGTGWENKINSLLVSAISHCSLKFCVDFLEFLMKRRPFKT